MNLIKIKEQIRRELPPEVEIPLVKWSRGSLNQIDIRVDISDFGDKALEIGSVSPLIMKLYGPNIQEITLREDWAGSSLQYLITLPLPLPKGFV